MKSIYVINRKIWFIIKGDKNMIWRNILRCILKIYDNKEY